jgi:hypothetical protein
VIGRFKGALELLDSSGGRYEGETAEDRGAVPAASPSQEKDLDEGAIPF